ncbi:7 transmembrane sweet-taste receptor of 3 GCPR-domain-containing protein [Zopfochytrium polystomum]|nr:7 transmembrane sweet-taste receptor of 3 GCPR-domain-containing protein [Zopfochytrium polystomum]
MFGSLVAVTAILALGAGRTESQKTFQEPLLPASKPLHKERYRKHYDRAPKSFYGLSGSGQTADAAAQLAFDDINSDLSIFPDANFLLKRIDSASIYLPNVGSNIPDSSNYAAINLYETVQADPSTTAGYLTLPYCVSGDGWLGFEDKAQYPTEFHTGPPMINKMMTDAGIKVSAKILLPISPVQADFDIYSKSLVAADARYSVLLIDDTFAPSCYKYLNNTGMVGPKYVWIITNYPRIFASNYVAKLGPTDFTHLNGAIFIAPDLTPTIDPVSSSFSERFMARAKLYPKWYYADNGRTVPDAAKMYDCVRLMVRGFDQMIKRKKRNSARLCQREARSDSQALLTILCCWIKKGMPTSTLTIFSGDNPRIVRSDKSWVFNGGSTIPPSDGSLLHTAVVNSAATGNGLAMLIMAALGLTLAFACITLNIAFRKEKAVVRSSATFTSLMAAGCGFALISAVVMVNNPSTATCHARLWLQLMGFAVATSAVLYKSARLFVIFSARGVLPKTWLKDVGGVAVVFVLAAVEAALLAGWTVSQNPQPVAVADGLTDMVVCKSQPNNQYPGHYILYAYNALLLAAAIAATRLAQLSDKVAVNYATDTATTLMATVLAAFAAVAFLPLVSSAAPSPQTDFTRYLVVWVVAVGAMLIAFVPKALEIAIAVRESALVMSTRTRVEKSSLTTKRIVGTAVVGDSGKGTPTGSAASADARRTSTLPSSSRFARPMSVPDCVSELGMVSYRTTSTITTATTPLPRPWCMARLSIFRLHSKTWLSLDGANDTSVVPVTDGLSVDGPAANDDDDDARGHSVVVKSLGGGNESAARRVLEMEVPSRERVDEVLRGVRGAATGAVARAGKEV